MVQITRKVYKDIKKYDHAQMNEFLEKLYVNAYNDAINKMAEERMKDIERSSVDYAHIEQELLNIKGIGEVKAKQIMEVLKNEGI